MNDEYISSQLMMLWDEPDFNFKEYLVWARCMKYQSIARVYLDEYKQQ